MQVGSGLAANEVLAGASVLGRPAEEFVNDASVEIMWAVKAHEHAEVYFNILCSVDPVTLKLTKIDDEIYADFRKNFPTFKLDSLDEEALKSEAAKEQWRPFCERYEHKVEEFNFASLVRIDASGDYDPENTILVTRIQFLAIEIGRCREGKNSSVRDKFKPSPRVKS